MVLLIHISVTHCDYCPQKMGFVQGPRVLYETWGPDVVPALLGYISVPKTNSSYHPMPEHLY